MKLMDAAHKYVLGDITKEEFEAVKAKYKASKKLIDQEYSDRERFEEIAQNNARVLSQYESKKEMGNC